MSKKVVTRRELLDRWRGIEEDDIAYVDLLKRHRFRHLASSSCLLIKIIFSHFALVCRFSDAFNYLITLPQEYHIWCGSWDLRGPLLETFYNYFKDDRCDSPLKLLLDITSREMRHCTQCICQYHQAQELYSTEYEPTSIGPLLEVLLTLDGQRITQHLKEINNRIRCGEYDIVHGSGEIVSVMFEVLMFPILLDDSYLASEFETFIDAIDKTHELTLGGHKQYPGVYALLFHKGRRARSIGLRLVGRLSKLRAKLSLWIMGNARTLQTNQNWAALVKDAKERELVISLKRPYNATFKSYDLEKHLTLEQPENCSRKLKHVKGVEATCEHADRQKKNLKHVTERKRKDTSFGAPIDTPIRADLSGKNVEGEQKSKGSDNHKHSISVASERFQEPLEHDDKLRNTRGWKEPTKTTLMQKDGEDGIGACNKVKKLDHIMSERKQQRDAVDALLSSALISSNKSRSSLRSLPAKRTSSPNVGGPPIRPPKQNKVKSLSY
ncbi:hypothetical protein K7X08_023848 [Anisodus acutangulus]|uniref:Helicase Sen1 N-terminal domain-containing protein n=1 Tax=Anisodus acutangulus TaxID=402998 RepID=A0A9Q1M6M6_9SOLA|nr:hypothetical protein K7X08_023848 [Anisodus acutangulus]